MYVNPFKQILCVALCVCSTCFASENEKSGNFFTSVSPRAELRSRVMQAVGKREMASFNFQSVETEEKSIKKSFLFSAVVPGAGQYYAESRWKAAAFLLVEVGAIWGTIHFNNQGFALEDKYEAYADEKWNEDKYWEWIEQEWQRNPEGYLTARAWEKDNFSHFLPSEKGQPYYENVGKYDQFIVGWEDFRENTLGGDISNFNYETYKTLQYNGQKLLYSSEQRNKYVLIRKDSNNNLKNATTMISVVLLNHVISAVDAAFTTKRFNSRIEGSLNLGGMRYGREMAPALVVGLKW